MLRNKAEPRFHLVLLLLGVCAYGCGTSDGHIPQPRPVQPPVHTAAGVTPQAATSVRDAHVQNLRQIRTLPPEIYDQMVAQEEQLQQNGIPSYRPIYLRGYFQAAYVEPETNKIAWRGMTCTHTDCPGQGHQGGPFVFPDVYPGLSVNAAGELVGQIPSKDVRCPACNRTDGVERYSPPEAVRSRGELQAELAEIRRQRDVARSSGQPLPELTRSPRELMSEVSNLPLLYLVEE